MPRRNHNADYHRPIENRPNPNIRLTKYAAGPDGPLARRDVVSEGYQPVGPKLDVTNPPQGGSGLKTTPEQIVREFRIMDRGIRIESVKEPVSKIERAIRIFLLITLGWGIGYLHHFLATAR
jgi:hypothetical protein